MQKKSVLLVIATYLVLFLAVAVCLGVGTNVSNEQASATSPWNVRVTKYVEPNYLDLSTGDTVTDSNSLYFLISNYDYNDAYQYYFSNNSLDINTLKNVSDTSWSNIVTTSTITLNEIEYIYHSEEVSSSFDKYIYFRRQVRTYEGGEQLVSYEYYSINWHIIVNTNLTLDDLDFQSITATYLKGAVNTPYNSEWISTPIKFTVKTKWMHENNLEYNPSSELLFYSVDGKNVTDPKKKWRPMSTNTVSVNENMNNITVYFKVTDIAGKYDKEVYYDKITRSYDNTVKMDIEMPTFTVSATTINANNEIDSYSSRAWACSDVGFEVTNNNDKCISPIEYSISVDGGVHYERLDTNKFIVTVTTKKVSFRSRSEAGNTSVSDIYEVNIDKITPVVRLNAFTNNPDGVNLKQLTITKDEESGIFNAGYANGNIIVNVFNKSSSGDYLNNTSPLHFYYAYATSGGQFSNFIEINSRTKDGDFYYYNLSDVISGGVITSKQYKFIIRTEANLVSEEVTLQAVLVNPSFEIEVKPISYSANESGWAASDIRVYVNVPTDTKIVDGQYTAPTTKYTFWYSPTNISGVLFSAQGHYANPISEGYSLYYFDLKASAESTFAIYATNAANKRSNNTHITPNIIKIDVLEPETQLTAYVKPTDESFSGPYQYRASGEWVNGRVIITLMVKDGVSGVYLKELEKALDGNGNPLYDDFGNIRWTEPIGIKGDSGSEVRPDGTKWYIYIFEKSNPSSSENEKRYSEEFRFRVYTNSGVSVEESFVLNIDNSNIYLENIEVDGGIIPIESETKELKAKCEDFTINLISNAEQLGHFVYYVDDGSGNFVRVDNATINITIPSGSSGEIIKRFYLESKAKNYLGESVSTSKVNVFQIVIPYDTVVLAINYELVTVMNPTVWNIAEAVEVKISLVSNIDGDVMELTPKQHEKYKHYYMLINYKPNINLNEEISKGDWYPCERSSGELDPYQFAINLSGKSFYGYLALSVTNEADFRSNSGDISGNIIKVDNTTPVITGEDGIIKYQKGEPSGNTYFSTEPISLVQTADSERNRSVRSYYYALLNEDGTTALTKNPVSDSELNGWTKLSGIRQFFADTNQNAPIYTQYKLMIFAQNEVGNKTGGIVDGIYTVYTFIIDPAPISGKLTYKTSEGGYFDSTLGMYAFWWADIATINLNIDVSNTELQYYFMRDSLGLWEIYIDQTLGFAQYYEDGVNGTQLIFSANYFPDGVKDTFTFKAINRAGAEYIYTQKIYIAIDTAEPDFSISTTVNNITYNGGSTDLMDKTGAWSSLPITVIINRIKDSVGGVLFEYVLTYQTAGSTAETSRKLTPTTDSFTTDRIDGFNTNNDVVLTIFATNKATIGKLNVEPATAIRKVRLRVDQNEPKFALTGHASEDDSTQSKIIVSGEWTNRKNVAITRASLSTNVSGVAYSYTYMDLDSTSVTPYDWPGDGSLSYAKTCTITVTARSGAGKSFTEIFQVNIDTIPPKIKYMSNISVHQFEKHFIDLKFYVEEENIEICEYITIKEDSRGFAMDPNGYIISTSSVDNSTRIDRVTGQEYRGYVRIYVKDYAGNEAQFVLYMLPFDLDINNITLSTADLNKVDGYERDLNEAEVYMEGNRVIYFRNLIARLRDRIATLENEILTYRAYLAGLAQRSSFELKSDYAEMFSYLETFNNYKLFGQAWLQDAIKGDASSIYYGYFNNLDVVFKQLRKEMEKVESVQKSTKILPAINMVESTDYNAILRVYDDYNDLTSDQKAVFNTDLYNKLFTLKKDCEILLLTDADTGIRLDGDFAPGAKVSVDSYKDTTEVYSNAQKALLSTVDSNSERAVVSVNRISLVGASSQTSTGEISVVLPIPDDYQQYIRFTVYKLSQEGTVSEMDDVIIAGDGKSVSFTSSELATFVLATKANVEGVVPSEGVYGTLLGLELDTIMIRNMVIVGGALFGIVIIVVIIAGIRHKSFLNSYNRAYRSSIYRRGVQRIPKGNALPRPNPLKTSERVKTQTKPY